MLPGQTGANLELAYTASTTEESRLILPDATHWASYDFPMNHPT